MKQETALPLQGITVVSCEQAVAAPFASRQLADLGARVIKVERPHAGDFARNYDSTVNGLSSHFVWLNRSKDSLTLNLKSPAAIGIMKKVIAEADVFIQNLAPGAIERLGLGAADLRRDNPRLITCGISGYGSSGPYRDAKAYDLLIQSEAGLVSITGSEVSPAKSGIPAADIAAGMYAFSGILTALYNRERTGVGAEIEVNLFDSLIEWMGYPMYYTEYGGTAPARAGTSHAAIAPYGTYTAQGGYDIVLSVQNDREWVSFCETVLCDATFCRDERFSTGSQRVEHREALDAVIDSVFSQHSGEEMERRLQAANVAHARQREVIDVLHHPQLTDRDRFRMVQTPAGPVRAVLPAITMVGVSPRMDAVPDVGEQSRAILGEFGYSDEQIDDLLADGVV